MLILASQGADPMSDLSNPIFHNEEKARDWLEARIWPAGPVCPHCGVVDQATRLKGKSHRPGLYQCNACREPFTVTVGTLYERSHIPLNKWLMATHLMMASKKGVSSLQLHRMLGVTKKTAWFMAHRIRESLRPASSASPLGGPNKVVEVDETYVGGKAKNRKNHIPPKEPVVALVEREGRVRSYHVANVDGENLRPILKEQIDKATHVMTDDSTVYPPITGEFAGHSTVNHSIEEYVRCGGFIHTNTIENYFSIFKRGVIGVYHHVSEQHLKRYLCEFDFRYNEREALGVDDAARMSKSIPGIVGRRLTYRRIGGRPEGQETAQS
jgi:transposase-like protein